MAYSSDPDATLACAAMCSADYGPCYISVWENSVCFMGDWNVESYIYTVTNPTAHVKRRKLFLYIAEIDVSNFLVMLLF